MAYFLEKRNLKNQLIGTSLIGVLSIGGLSPPALAVNETDDLGLTDLGDSVIENANDVSEEIFEEASVFSAEDLVEENLKKSEDHSVKFSMPTYYPDSETVYELKDSTLMLQKFIVSSETNPADLLREPFEYLGYRYEFQGIKKDQLMSTDTKEFEEKITIDLRVTNKQAAYEALIPMLEPTLEYEDEEGIYKGELLLDSESITFSVLNSRSTSSSVSTTRTYTSSYNDDSIIPQTITADGATWYLKSRTWSSGSNISDASLPSSYTATAVYSRSVSSTVNDGYTATISYRGVLTAQEEGDICYEVTYMGIPLGEVSNDSQESTTQSAGSSLSESSDDSMEVVTASVPEAVSDFFSGIPEFFKSLSGTSDDDGSLETKIGSTAQKLGYYLASIASGAVALFLSLKVIKVIANNRSQSGGKAVIAARDEFSGVESRIQKTRITTKKPVITINYAKAPQATHFTVTLKPEVAELFTGRRITINIGKEVRTHLVGQSHNNDYVISVDWNG